MVVSRLRGRAEDRASHDSKEFGAPFCAPLGRCSQMAERVPKIVRKT